MKKIIIISALAGACLMAAGCKHDKCENDLNDLDGAYNISFDVHSAQGDLLCRFKNS